MYDEDPRPFHDAYVVGLSELGLIGRTRARMGIVLAAVGYKLTPDPVLEEFGNALEEALE